MKNRTYALIFAVSFAIAAMASLAFGQSTSHMDALRDKLKADKKVLVSHNMDLTDAEAKKFWPIYDEYQKGLQKLNDRTSKMITDYADAYNAGAVQDSTAKRLLNEAMSIDESELKMKKSAITKLHKVLPAVKVARYMQMENKIRAVIKYEMADSIPLAE